jgi:hypothetical protein
MISFPRIIPGDRFVGQMWATIRAEIIMQWRRWGFWIAFVCTAILLGLLTVQAALYLHHLPADSLYYHDFTPTQLNYLMIYNTTIYGTMFFGFVAALLVVDRMERDQLLSMLELQRVTPQGDVGYVLGKYLGNYIAVLIPVFLSYLLCAGISFLLGWSIALFPMIMQAFFLVYVPSSLALVGLTLWLASAFPVRIVQIVITLFWLFLNIGSDWNKLSHSIFNPNGLYVYPVIFPISSAGFQPVETSLLLAVLNIAVLILTAFVTLLLTVGNIVYQRYRKEVA